MNLNYYNNISVGVIALGSTLEQSREISLSKLFLVFPLISHQKLLQYLGRKNTSIKSIENLIAEKTSYFSNFNKRYSDSLPLTMNALQYLHDTGYVNVVKNSVLLVKNFEYDKKMGSRANKIFNASKNISILLNEEADKLYLNLRVEL